MTESKRTSTEERLALMQAEEKLARARAKLLAFTCYTKPDYLVNWHHREMARKLNQFLAGEIPFLMIFTPPRHGKSELVSRRLPPLIHGLYPDDEIMAASYSDSLAAEMTVAVQAIMDTPEYALLFPHVRINKPGISYAKGVRNTNEHTIIGHRGKYRGQGVGGSFTGKGANWILIDDPIKGRESADSEAFRRKLWDFYNNDLFTRLETNIQRKRPGQILITQTRWHEDDLSGRLLELQAQDPLAAQFIVFSLPAIKEEAPTADDPRNPGEALWPDKYDVPKLQQIRATVKERAWNSLFQQTPTPASGVLFKHHMFEICDPPGAYTYTFMTIDTAYEEKQENDFTVATAWGVKVDQPYILGVYRKQIGVDLVEDDLELFIRAQIKWGYRGTYIEPKGHGIYLNKVYAKKKLMIPSEDRRKEFFADRSLDKVERANHVIPHLSHRKIYIARQIPDTTYLLKELTTFPKGKHDDFVDTVIDGLKVIYGKAPSTLDAFR